MDGLMSSNSSYKNDTADVEKGSATEREKNIALPKRVMEVGKGFLQKRTPTNLSARAKVRRDLLPRKGHVVKLDKNEILKATLHHEKYTFNGTTLKGLGKFDDSRDYGISEAGEKAMIEAEVTRLIKVCTAEEPYLFSSEGCISDGEKSFSFEDVSNVVDQILANWEIIKHDNARLLIEHCQGQMDRGSKDYTRSRLRLKARYMQKDDDVEGCQPKLLNPPERNIKLYFALVDYIIGNIARLMVRSATSQYWEVNILSTLAQWAAKLKNLSYDPAHYAALSLSNGEDVMNQAIAGLASKSAFLLKWRISTDEGSSEKEVDTFGDEDFNTKTHYYEHKTGFRYFLEYVFRNAAGSLLKTEGSSNRPGCFESCTLVYRAGLDEKPTMVSNGRDGDISASSDIATVNFSYTAMALLLKNLKVMSQPDMLSTDKSQAIVEWHWSDGKSGRATPNRILNVESMDQIISFMVPLGLTNTYVASIIDDLVYHAFVNTEEDHPIMQFEPPPRKFKAMFKITTTEFLQKKVQQESLYYDNDTRPVADSPMRQGIRPGCNLRELVSPDINQSVTHADPTFEKRLRDKNELLKSKMDSWVISEDAIIIKCRFYVFTIIALALVVVFGGLAVPFVVGERIRGVDPFQLASFSWVLAGFITIIGKSWYVAIWPWHDFLSGRVVCHSVKDVHDVTGVDSQMIIWKILHSEYDSILKTHGPYNGMSTNKRDGGSGFAIDEAVDLSTMLASGFIMLKVLNEKGQHLICMDVRQGTGVEYHSRLEKEKFLACMDIGKEVAGPSEDDSENEGIDEIEDKKTAKPATEKVLRLSQKEFRWNKMLGIYTHDSKFG